MNTNTMQTIQGMAKSITMWVAGALLALGQLVPYVTPATLASLGITDGVTATRILTACAVIMAVCRYITKQSLASKMAPPTGVSLNASISSSPDSKP